MLKTAVSLWTAITLLLGGGYHPSMTQIDHCSEYIYALEQSYKGAVGPEDICSVKRTDSGYLYTNYCDGCSFVLPKRYSTDVSLSNIRLRLTSNERRIDIYRESFANAEDCSTYAIYSARFTGSAQEQRTTQINGRTAHIVQWSRESLGADDFCCYVNIDITVGTDVYSFTVSSKQPLEEEEYMALAESAEFFEPTAAAYVRPFEPAAVKKSHEETAAVYEELFVKEHPVQWGLYLHKQPQQGMSRFEDTEHSLGTRLKICMFYAFLYDSYDPALVGDCLRRAWDSQKLCELTLQLPPAAKEGMVYDILKGSYDGFLTEMAEDIKSFDHPVILRLFNEMNGEWCNYSGCHTARDPQVYVRLYRYIVELFRRHGAENVIWLWNPNEKSFPNFKWNSEELYWPGDEYVDVVGLTGYNTGDYYKGETWRSFDRIYHNIYKKADMLYNRPMMITEFACAKAGGDKAQWVEEMLASLDKYPKLKAAVWWSSCDYGSDGSISRSYFIDDTAGVMSAFRAHFSQTKAEKD